MNARKVLCTHYIQPSVYPVIAALGLVDELELWGPSKPQTGHCGPTVPHRAGTTAVAGRRSWTSPTTVQENPLGSNPQIVDGFELDNS